MKVIPVQVVQHYNQLVTTTALGWHVTRTDGNIYAFTNHTRSIRVADVLYLASAGFTATQSSSRTGLNVDNLDVKGAITAIGVTESDILAGIWDFAYVRIIKFNYKAPADGYETIREGWIGDISSEVLPFTAEIRGLTTVLQHHIGRIVQPPCDADLGDSRCGVNIEALKLSRTVDVVTSNRVFSAVESLSPGGTHWDMGHVTVTSGSNAGRTREIKSVSGQTITLQLAFPYPLTSSVLFDIYPGCDKSASTCNTKYGNIVNQRGFPFSPNLEDAVAT